jgi:hypothetical protein
LSPSPVFKRGAEGPFAPAAGHELATRALGATGTVQDGGDSRTSMPAAARMRAFFTVKLARGRAAAAIGVEDSQPAKARVVYCLKLTIVNKKWA